MAKEQKWQKPSAPAPEPKKGNSSQQHLNPVRMWETFDQCWADCVKNGNDVVKQSAIAHIKSIGAWHDQAKWVDALVHFGIPVEKK